MKWREVYKLLFIVLIIILVGFFYLQFVLAATNIDSVYKWAWNDDMGWIDFGDNNVYVLSNKLTGWATSTSAGIISLDCGTSPIGNICSTSNYYVSNNGSGALSGYAWNDNYGWISFSCDNNNWCATSSYGVSINSSGIFSGWAWSDTAGWISFNCDNPPYYNVCANSNYYVKTSWTSTSTYGTLDSSTFDTGVASGAAINSIMWLGSANGGQVLFQIATSSTSTGPWNFVGPGGDSNTWWGGAQTAGQSIPLDYNITGRYFRYRVYLVSTVGQTATPVVTTIIVNWSQ